MHVGLVDIRAVHNPGPPARLTISPSRIVPEGTNSAKAPVGGDRHAGLARVAMVSLRRNDVAATDQVRSQPRGTSR